MFHSLQDLQAKVGLAPQRDLSQPTALEALFGSDGVGHRVFALCLAEWGGLLTVGGANESLHVAAPSPPASPSPPPCLTKAWAPCGGSGKPTACCPDGYTCLARSPAFSQCAPAIGPIGAALRRI